MLIAIEGIDGSGKGTQATQLLERTRNLGYTSELVSFPRYNDTHCSKMVAAYLNGEFGTLEEVPPVFAATLFALDRLESLAHIERACEENDLVIVDRYVASNLAYQSARITNPERARFTEWLFNLEYEIYDLPKPDLTLFLEVPAHTSKELVAQKETRTYTEKVYDLHERDSTYLSSVREVYHALITSKVIDPCLIIDCQDRHGALRAMGDIGQEICDAVVQHKNSNAGVA
ncbi:MAG: dTMP kinase [Bacteroidetes bacterium]|nr:dTMP kinase [Bacteroidota bacterium]